jgi:cysteine desulfurase
MDGTYQLFGFTNIIKTAAVGCPTAELSEINIKNSYLNAISGLNYTINGDQNYCLPSTINISFHGVDAEGIFLAIKEDYAFSNGSACNSGSHAPSYVLTAMGLDENRISEAIRVSWNYNTQVDFTSLIDYVKAITE